MMYEINMSDRRRKKRIFHVNMLRKWIAPIDSAFSVEEDIKEDDRDIVYWEKAGGEQPVVNSHLSPQQVTELHGLLHEFQDVLQGEPGNTTTTEHTIKTGSAQPIRLAPYRLPHAYRDAIRKELQEMERAGIIEQSSSAWAAPIVPVKKKDGSLRLCVDYRRLNAVSTTDAYPMPRVDDMIDQLGGAHFIITLDLCKGYWQVPLREVDRPKTAFTTPQGLYQFRMMPFGLQGAPATFQRMMDSFLHVHTSDTLLATDESNRSCGK